MKRLAKSYTIKASPDKVWKALVDPAVIAKWGGGPAQMSEEEGMEFDLWGGDIWGKNIEVLPKIKLVQEWYGGDWEKPSVLTIILIPDGDGTKLKLVQEGVPTDEAEEIDSGWDEHYLGPLKEWAEKSV